jgi:hypothetical protein
MCSLESLSLPFFHTILNPIPLSGILIQSSFITSQSSSFHLSLAPFEVTMAQLFHYHDPKLLDSTGPQFFNLFLQ